MRDLSGVRCVGYVRVSTEKQAGEKQTSPEDQRAAIDALAAKLGVTVGEWFTDPGYSGATYEKRPALNDLVESCEAHPKRDGSGLVLALNDSRWGRFHDPEEATFWRVHLRRLGWVVRFAEQDETEDKTVRPLLRALHQSQATIYRDTLSANSRRGMRGTAAQGFWGTRAPYGYRRKVVYPPGRERVLENGIRKAPDEKVALVVEPAESRIVLEAFTRYANGLESGASLVTWLKAHAPGRTWAKPSVMHLLRNPVYVGDVMRNRRLHANDGRPRTGPWRLAAEEWYGCTDAHEPIVSRALFARVAERFTANAAQKRGVHGVYVVTGLVRCATCGSPMIGGGRGKVLTSGVRQAFYRCGSVERGIVCGTGTLPCVAKPKLEGAVVDAIARTLETPSVRREIVRALDRHLARLQRAQLPSAASLAKEVAALEQKKARLVAAIAAGAIDSDDAREQMQAIKAQLAAAEQTRANAAVLAQTATASRTERDRLVRMATDFPTLARQIDGAALRELIRPWLAGAAFDRTTRLLTLHIRPIPSPMLVMADSPAPTNQDPHWLTRHVALPAGRRDWVLLEVAR